MPRNFYPGKTIDELLPVRERLMEARNGGSLTSVGIAQGIKNDFAAQKPADLDKRLEEVDYALYLKAVESENEDTIALYPNPYAQKNMKICTVYCPA